MSHTAESMAVDGRPFLGRLDFTAAPERSTSAEAGGRHGDGHGGRTVQLRKNSYDSNAARLSELRPVSSVDRRRTREHDWAVRKVRMER